MRQLYVAIAIPKMSYAADVWYTHPHKANESSKKRTGSIKFIQKLQSVQQRATIAMLGAMQTTAGDVLNAHAHLPPPFALPYDAKPLRQAASHAAKLTPLIQTFPASC